MTWIIIELQQLKPCQPRRAERRFDFLLVQFKGESARGVGEIVGKFQQPIIAKSLPDDLKIKRTGGPVIARDFTHIGECRPLPDLMHHQWFLQTNQ